MTPLLPGVAEASVAGEVESRVRDILTPTLDLDGSEPPAEVTRERLAQWTSLRHMVLMAEIEEAFGIALTMNEMGQMTSMPAIVDAVAHHLRPLPSSRRWPAEDERPHGEAPPAARIPSRPIGSDPRWRAHKVARWLNASWQWRGRRTIGRWVRVTGRMHIRNEGEMLIGDRVQIDSKFARTVLATIGEGRLDIGEQTIINYGSDICATGSIRIGRRCLIGTHAIILDNDFHEVNAGFGMPPPKPVVLDDDVWLGNRVTVLPGVRIGAGTVVSAGSVVMSDLPPRVVAAGNPARVVQRVG